MRRGWLLAIAGTFVFGACGGGDSSPTVTPDGTAFSVKVGEELTIVLDSNVTTGFSWQAEQPLDDAVVTAVDDDYLASSGGGTGAGGLQELTFEGAGAGSTTIELWYIRSFDDPPDPAERASFPVEVAAD